MSFLSLRPSPVSILFSRRGDVGPSAPVNTALPEITGTTTLSCSTGTWTGEPTSYAYQWRRNGEDIEGATSSTYEVTGDDYGQSITCVVTATNAGGSTSAESEAVVPDAPESITDGFDADSGDWLDGALEPAAITVDNGRGIWSPTEEAELHTSSNAAADPNGTEANATTGWSATGATVSVESTDVDTGSYAIKVAASDGLVDRAALWRSNPSRKWRVVRLAAKAVVGSTWNLFTQGTNFNPRQPITSDWSDYVYAVQKSADYTEDGFWCQNGTASDIGLVDNVSIKELTPSSQFRVQRIYYPSTVTVDVWLSLYTPVGVVYYKDIDNYVMAVMRRSGNDYLVDLYKSVDGAFSSVSAGNVITYSAGATLELIPAADMQSWTVKYDGVTEVNAAAITDFAASGTWYAGLLTSHNPGDTAAVGFDNFAAVRIGESPPFESAPAEIGATATLVATKVVRESLTEPDWFGRPAVSVLSDGTVVMVYYRGTGHAENQGAIHICFSDDYGATWTDEDTDLNGNPVPAFPMNPPDADEGEDGNEPWLVRYDDDTLLLFIWRNDWTPTPVYHGTYQSKSTDGGLTWTTPTAVTIDGAANSNTSFLTNDHFIYDGRLYCAYEDKNNGGERCCVAYTDDKGDNWTHLSVIANNASEAALEYIGNNTVISILRAGGNNHTYFNKSTNLASSWGSVQELTWRIPAIGRPRIKTRAHLQEQADWWTDECLILWGYVYDGNGDRINMVSLSKNAGASWTTPFELDDPYHDAGYGDMFYNPNTGEYVFMCYRGHGSFGPARLVQYNISVDWGT